MNRRTVTARVAIVAATSVVVCAPAFAAEATNLDANFFMSLIARIAVACAGLLLMASLLDNSSDQEEAAELTRLELDSISTESKEFGWDHIEDRVAECFGRVHNAWGKSDMSLAKDAMTSWYWQNQQLNFVNEWSRQGIKNVCHVDTINSITPLLLHRENEDSLDNTHIVVRINALMLDYLVHSESQTILAGIEDYRDIETVWTLSCNDGQWKVCDIEDVSVAEQYASACCEISEAQPLQTNPNELRA